MLCDLLLRIERVKYSDWATPIVPVPKPDGTVRVCSDFKITVNPVLHVDQHPIPKAEDLFATLAGGKKFSKLDLSQAYQQVLLHPDDCKYTINTHLGLFQYTRLPFSIASCSSNFSTSYGKDFTWNSKGHMLPRRCTDHRTE